MMNKKQKEAWAPWLLLVATVVLWQIICSAFNVSEFIFPSPLRIWEQTVEHAGTIAGHAWRTFWVTMVGFGLAIVVGWIPVLGTCILAPAITIASFVFSIMGIVKALKGERWRIPLVADLADKF